MKDRGLALAVIAATVIGVVPAARGAGKESRAWVKAIPDQVVWKNYSKTVGSDEFGKCIIDVKTNDIYFFDVNLFNIHADFVLGVLLKQAWTADNLREYNKNYERDKPKFILCYLTHHLKVNRWTFSFWEGDKIGANDVMRVKQRLAETFFVKDIVFRPDSPMQQKVANEVARRGVPTITNDTIYKSADYQAFNRGATIGKLHVVPIGTPYEQLTFDRDDIALLQE
ncbi:MAG TPA: hypothetical protein VHN14_15615, partial [Kofleriaceae bacterium]|nr:hypothetical protein [Kofleriaceae bacterium]